MLMLFFFGVFFELLLATSGRVWHRRRLVVVPALVLLGVWTGALLPQLGLINAVLILVISIFRVINLLKIARPRVNPEYLRDRTRRTSLVLVGLQLSILLLMEISLELNVEETLLWLAVLQFLAALFILNVTARNLFKTRHHKTKHFYSDKELPTVTVAIPARNETDDLSSCLHSVLANNYPKLEVLVLDDCSQDRTAEIIKSFAHDGVRFVKGREPKERWLAKNQAYDKLADEANGELILFCGVDVRFGPDAIRSLVTTMLNKKRSMMSVMPFRIGGGVQTSLVQPMRYWWELALPRRLFNRPPVLSTCWLIRRKSLQKLGGFDAVARTVVPEGYFARELVKQDGYAFIRADEHLDVRTVKSVPAQLQTALRTHYPQLRKRPENVLILSVLELTLLLGPFLILPLAIWADYELVAWMAGLAATLLVLVHYLILSASNPANSVIALFNLPSVIMAELSLLYTSMYKYEFSDVEWKGRNICLPVMQVIPKLPAMSERSAKT